MNPDEERNRRQNMIKRLFLTGLAAACACGLGITGLAEAAPSTSRTLEGSFTNPPDSALESDLYAYYTRLDYQIPLSEIDMDMADVKDLDDLTQFLDKRLTGLDFLGYEVTDVFFFDHSGGGENIDGLYFGENVYITASDIAAKGKDLVLDRILPESCTVHFRHCYVGSEKNRDLLKNLATWTNRNVTGGTRMTGSTYPHGDVENPLAYDHGWEYDGPDYTYGSLWGASVGGSAYEIWPEYRETTWWEKNVQGMADQVRNENRPY
jgi:hypothetical protein